MCLLIFKPADKTLPFEHLKNGYEANSDGSGLAIADGDKVIIHKGPNWTADDIADYLEKYKGCPAIVHFRYATHGSENYLNTHPFPVGKTWVAGHNGVISGIPCYKDESDSRAFLRKYVLPIVSTNDENDPILADKDVLKHLGKEMGTTNKMVFLNHKGSYGIANEDVGHWLDGIWYSNYGYKPRFSGSGTCGYTGGTASSHYMDDDHYWPSHYSHYNRDTEIHKPTNGKPVQFNQKWYKHIHKGSICDFCEKSLEDLDEFYFEPSVECTLCKECFDEINS